MGFPDHPHKPSSLLPPPRMLLWSLHQNTASELGIRGTSSAGISYNHRMGWVGRDLKDQTWTHSLGWVPSPKHLPLHQAAQSPTQPSLEHFQGRGIHSCRCLTTFTVKNFSLISNPNLFQFKAIVPCSSLHALLKNNLPQLFWLQAQVPWGLVMLPGRVEGLCSQCWAWATGDGKHGQHRALLPSPLLPK